MAKSKAPPTRPPKPIALDDSVAGVGSRSRLERRALGNAPPKPTDNKNSSSWSGETTGNTAMLLPMFQDDGPPLPPPDISAREADELIHKGITPLVQKLRTEYSTEHVVFPGKKELMAALAKGAKQIEAARDHLHKRTQAFAGPNVDRVLTAWVDALLALGDITLQEDHWAAEPVSLVGAWRQKVRLGEDGDTLMLGFVCMVRFSLRSGPAQAELENQALPEWLSAMLDLVDWSEQECLGRDLLPEEADFVVPLRRRVVGLLTALPPPQQRAYVRPCQEVIATVTRGAPKGPRPGRNYPLLDDLWIEISAPL